MVACVAKWAQQPGWFQALPLHWCCGSATSLFGLHGAPKVGLAACFKFYRRTQGSWLALLWFFRQTSHNEAFCAVAASGCWQVACVGVHTGACIVGCSLKQPASPPARHTPICRLLRKKAGRFLALQAINQKTPTRLAHLFCVATRMQKLGLLNAKLH